MGGGGGGNFVYTGGHRALQVYPTPSPYHNPQLAFLPPSIQVGHCDNNSHTPLFYLIDLFIYIQSFRFLS